MLPKLSEASNSIKSASFAQLGAKLISVIAQLGVTMVLARLLTPEQYGVVAILASFNSLFTIIGDAGISTAIAKYQDLTKEDHERLFFVSLLLGLALTVFFFLLSMGIAAFYGNPEYVTLGGVMTLAVLFNSLNMVPNGLLIKERKFTLIGVRLVASTVVVGLMAIALAFAGFGAYAIVLQSVLTALFVLVWNVLTSHVRMSFGAIRPVLHKVGRFSAYQLGNNVIVWFSGNVDTLLVGKLFGSASLGYYNKAFNLYGYPLNILVAPITTTLIPFFAPLQDDLDALRLKFFNVFRKVSLIGTLCTVWMSACASEVILIMYGDNWEPAIPLLHVLALAVYARSVNSVHAPLLSATGKSDLLMHSSTFNTIFTVVMIFFGAFFGDVQGLATCIAIAYNCELFLPVLFSARHCLHVGALGYFAKYLLPDMVIGVMAIVLCGLIPWPQANVFLLLLGKAVFCGLFVLALRNIADAALFHEGMLKLRR